MEVQDRIEKSLPYRECEQLQRDVAFGMAFRSDRSRIVGALGGTDNVQAGKPGDVSVCRRYPFYRSPLARYMFWLVQKVTCGGRFDVCTEFMLM